MPFKYINSAVISGLEATLINVEINIDNKGFPRFDIVGLAAKEINESRERIKAAIRNSGLKFPNKKILVNLAPADLPKKGALYDLPIAVGILCASDVLNISLDEFMFAGELSLDGTISKIPGATLVAIEAKLKNKILVIPEENLFESSFVKGLKVLTYKNFGELVFNLQNKKYKFKKAFIPTSKENKNDNNLLENIRGHQGVKRALHIAAAGRHNICLIGSPGAGKTILARSVESILPDLSEDDLAEVMKINSLTGTKFSISPKFRSPVHPISLRALIGFGTPLTLGEITLAHKGVLFLDEFTEYEPNLINSLRQPIDDKKVQLYARKHTLTLPCDFMLIISANPCACGNYGDPDKKCVCTSMQIKKYQSRLKNPLMDRIDLFVNVFSISSEELINSNSQTLTSNHVKQMITSLRDIQVQRCENFNIDFKNNADLSSGEINKICTMQNDAVETLNALYKKYSSRSIHKIIKVARTIADIEDSADIKKEHLLEAVQYKSYF